MKKKLLVIFILIGSMIGFVNAKPNDTQVRVDYLKNVYGNFMIGDLFYWNQIGLTYANNKLAYCLEPGKWITENIYDSYTDFSIKNLDKEDKEYLELVAYYGYQYPSHQTTKYYLATQELIWRYLGLKELYWTTKAEHQGERINVESEKKEIKRLMDGHYNKPSFHGQTYEVISGVPFYLNEKNGILHDYGVILPVNQDTKIEGNKLIIYPQKVGETTISFLRYPNSYQASFLYTKNNSQALGTFGLSSRVEANVHIKVKGYQLAIHKKDADTDTNEPSGDATLEGAVYEISNGLDYLNTMKTDRNGVATLKDIPAGTYKIKEIKAPEGYLLDKKIYTVTFNQDTNLEVDMDMLEEVIKNKVKLIKVFSDGETGILKPEVSIHFGIYKKDGTLYQEVVTDSYGSVSFELPYGDYVVKQLNTLPNYEKVKDFEIHVTEDKKEPIQYVLHDKFIRSKLKIKKVDEIGNPIRVENITFKIKNLDTGEYVKQNLTYPENKVIEEFQTDQNGEILLPSSLPAGRYELEEKTAPTGYYKLEAPIPFTLNEDTKYEKTEDGLLYTIEVKNIRQKGKVKIKKQGRKITFVQNEDGLYEKQEEMVPLTGVVFTLYAKENIVENEKIIYKQHDIVEKLETKNGEVISKELPLGSYCLKETYTVEDYILDEKEYCFQIEATENQDRVMIKEFSFVNEVPHTKIELLKKAEKMIGIDKRLGVYQKIPFEQIEFGIYNQEPIKINHTTIPVNTLLMKEVTNQEGRITFENLPFGTYVIKELTDKKEYKKSKEIVVKVTKEEPKKSETVVNEKKKGSILILKQDNHGKLLSNAIFTITDETGKAIYQDQVDENGMLLLESLEYGTYYIEEIKAPDGYQRMKGKRKVELYQDNVVNKIVVKNKKLILPDTSSLNKIIEKWMIIGFGSMITFFFLAFFLKKKRHG